MEKIYDEETLIQHGQKKTKRKEKEKEKKKKKKKKKKKEASRDLEEIASKNGAHYLFR